MAERRTFECTLETPWDKTAHVPGTQVIHTNTHQLGEQENGWPSWDIITLECRNCGHQWRQELPQ